MPITQMMKIVIFFIFTTVSLEFSNAESHSASFVKLREPTPSYHFDSMRITAASKTRYQEEPDVCAKYDSNDSAATGRRRNPHNLYRFVWRVCNLIKHFSYKVGRLLRLPNLVENHDVSTINLDVVNKEPTVKRFFPYMGSFISKKLPDIGGQAPFSALSNIFSRAQSERTNQTSQKHFNPFSRRLIKVNTPSQSAFVVPSSWGGLAVTEKEGSSLKALHERRVAVRSGNGISSWLMRATGADFLRFLRTKNGDTDAAWHMILAHAKWRTTKYGADTICRNHAFDRSILHRELFWLGVSEEGHPTLVIRTQAHDGADYNEDPRVFTRCAGGLSVTTACCWCLSEIDVLSRIAL
jgi:hypothetical protein